MSKGQDLHINTSQMVVFCLRSASEEQYRRIMSGEKWLIIPREIMVGIGLVRGIHAVALSNPDSTEHAAFIVRAYWHALHDLIKEPIQGLGVSAEVFRQEWDKDHPQGSPLAWEQAPIVLCFEIATSDDGGPYHLSRADPELAEQILSQVRRA